MHKNPNTAAAFQLAFEGYSRPADTFQSDRGWAIWQHTKLPRIFELLQKEHLETESLHNAEVKRGEPIA